MRLGYPIGWYLFWRFRAQALGRKNIPASGPTMFVGNHKNSFDGVLVLLGIPRRVRTIVKSDQESKIALLLLKLLADMFTINRSSSDIGAIRKAAKVLESGTALCMFPTAHRDEKVMGFHPGVASIARRVEGLKIVPFGITYAGHLSVGTVVRNLHRGISSEHRPTIRFGKPFELPSAHLSKKEQRKADLTLIRRRVLDLLPPDMEGENILHVVER